LSISNTLVAKLHVQQLSPTTAKLGMSEFCACRIMCRIGRRAQN